MEDQELKVNWTLPKVLAAIVGVGWISVQAIVPLFWLIERGFDPKPRQFGWQMYSNMAGGDRFQVVYSGDRVTEVDIDQFVHNVRPGLDYDEIFLDYLCQQFPNAKQSQRISVRKEGSQVYQCRN